MKKILIAILAITIVQSIFSQERISELSFEYEASSRGFYQRIKVEKGILFFQENRNKSKDVTVEIDEKQWEKLVGLVKKVELENLSLFKAPSKRREIDGAAIAKLKVIKNENEFTSTNFDHGNPPLEIKNLVNYIISLSQSGKKD